MKPKCEESLLNVAIKCKVRQYRQAMEQHPLEQDLTLLITRASVKAGRCSLRAPTLTPH